MGHGQQQSPALANNPPDACGGTVLYIKEQQGCNIMAYSSFKQKARFVQQIRPCHVNIQTTADVNDINEINLN